MHPFDYQDEDIQRKDHAKSHVSRISQGSLVNEEVVKMRIVDCTVDFPAIWNSMPDGDIQSRSFLLPNRH